MTALRSPTLKPAALSSPSKYRQTLSRLADAAVEQVSSRARMSARAMRSEGEHQLPEESPAAASVGQAKAVLDGEVEVLRDGPVLGLAEPVTQGDAGADAGRALRLLRLVVFTGNAEE